LDSAVDSGVGGLENAEDFIGALMSDSSSSNDLTPCEELNGILFEARV